MLSTHGGDAVELKTRIHIEDYTTRLQAEPVMVQCLAHLIWY